MAYLPPAYAFRRCTAIKADGTRCCAWACWDDPLQRCVCHAGRHRRGKYGGPRKSTRTRYRPCKCAAYAWPHRPGSGLCRWPLEPLERLETLAGTHRWPRIRNPFAKMLADHLLRIEWQEKLRKARAARRGPPTARAGGP